MINTLVHRWLRMPYYLNVRHIHKARKSRITVLLIHGLGDTADMWQPVIDKLPQDVSVIAVDLLGFGDSPRPAWEAYNAKAQVRSLLATCLKLRVQGPMIIVGHSLGALVAVEFAKRYPLLTKSLILCSPPIYKQIPGTTKSKSPDMILRKLYNRAAAEPRTILRLYGLARATRMVPKSLLITEDNVQMLIASLKASIINQTTIDDIVKLNKPIKIINGLFDPLVVRSNLVVLAKQKQNITFKEISASHNITGTYAKEVAATIEMLAPLE